MSSYNKKNTQTKNKTKKLAYLMTVAFIFVTIIGSIYIVVDLNSPNNGNKDNLNSNSGLTSLSNINHNYDRVLKPKEIATLVKPSVVGILCLQSENFSYNVVSQGTGIIFRSDGYIITNSHVVLDGKLNGKYQVVLDDKSRHEAKLIGFDIKTDLAIVKIDVKGLPIAQFGNSEQVSVGEDVIAIGNPYSLSFAGTTTKGIISGVDSRINVGTSNYTMKTLQTDAAISPGNSGGPLVNVYGQVIGINSVKIAAKDVEGMGFAIPSNVASFVVDNLLKYGYVKERVRIGITYTSINAATAQLNDIPMGIRVTEVDEATSSYSAGVRAGDIIYKLDGNAINSYGDISDVLLDKKPGDKMVLSIFRINDDLKEENIELSILLEEDIPLE